MSTNEDEWPAGFATPWPGGFPLHIADQAGGNPMHTLCSQTLKLQGSCFLLLALLHIGTPA